MAVDDRESDAKTTRGSYIGDSTVGRAIPHGLGVIPKRLRMSREDKMNRSDKITLFKDDNGFLSNFYPCKIVLDGVDYPSVEHAFQASKTHEYNVRLAISKLSTPGKAKRFGRAIKLREDWESVKLGMMLALVRQKFYNYPELAERLLATGDAELIEGNWWGDTYWGVCMGKGENHLGKILMRVREELRAHG